MKRKMNKRLAELGSKIGILWFLSYFLVTHSGQPPKMNLSLPESFTFDNVLIFYE
jgi:hypothetical protein